MRFFTLTNYAVGVFTPPSPKKSEKYHFFPSFSIFSLMVLTLHLNFSLLLVIIIKCEKMSSKKTQKKRDFLFQHSILFFENGQK